MKFMLFLFTLICFINCYVHAETKECETLLKQADTCMKKIIYLGDPDIKVIRSEDDLNQHCREVKEAYNCLTKYGKCITLAQKEIYTSFTRAAKKMIKKRCDTESGRKDFFKHVQCVRKPEVYEINKCFDKMLVDMKYISENMKGQKILETNCCTFQTTLRCLREQADQYCKDVTGPDSGRYLTKMAQAFTDEIVDLFCGERNSVAQCQRLNPDWLKLSKSLSGQARPKEGFTKIMLKIIDKSTAEGVVTSQLG